MRKVYLNSLKDKLKLSDEIVNTIYDLLEKLKFAGYITNSKEMDLVDRLYENVDRVLIDTEVKEDYKSGYYDAHKKELYIKDINNKKAVYQRFLYAMTTREIEKGRYMVGYSYTSMQKNSFKLSHEGFGFNRAVIANLASKLVDSQTNDITFNLTYTTYKANFLGYDIISENDNYYFESNLFSQLCYALNIDKEIFYEKLFSRSPIVEMHKVFEKIDFDHKKYMDTLDELSRKYSNYNKLRSYVNLLNDVYKKIQKDNKENEKETRKLLLKERKIKREINNSIIKYSDVVEIKNGLEDEGNVQEVLEEIESFVISSVITIQNILSEYLYNEKVEENAYEFASRLKQYNNMLIVKDKKIEKLIYETITERILKTNELTSVNLVEKIKYSLVQELISSDKYNGVYKDFSFKKIDCLEEENKAYIIVISKGHFVQAVKVSELDNRVQRIENNTEIILTDNFRHILNSDYMQVNVNKVEKIYTELKEKYSYFNKITTENINYFEENGVYYLIMQYKENIFMAKVTEELGELSIDLIDLSENYYIFKQEFKKQVSLLPVLYKGEENIFSLIFKSFKAIFAN